MSRECTKCGEIKDLVHFYLDQKSTDGHSRRCKVCANLNWNKWRRQNPIKKWISSTRAKCNKRGIEFNLTEDYLSSILPECCPILDIKLEFGRGRSKIRSAPSLDRIDPDSGYVVGNVQWLSQRANAMKQDATPEELKLFCTRMLLWIK